MTIEWRKVAGQVFAALGRARLSTHQAILFERLVRVTLMQRRQAVRILRWDVFERFALPKAKVSMALNGFWSPNEQSAKRKWVAGLVELGLLQMRRHPDGGVVLTVMPDTTQWRCDWRFTLADDDWLLREVNAVVDQVQPELIEPEKDLPAAMAEVSAEAASSQIGNAVELPVSNLETTGRRSVQINSSAVSTALYKADKAVEQLNSARAKENKLFQRLKKLMQESPVEKDREDLAAWGGHWRVKEMRPDLEKFAAALRVVEADIAAGREAHISRGAWIKDLLRR